MIIDIHTHVGEYKKHYSERYAKIFAGKFGQTDLEKMWTIVPAEFMRDMDEAGVDKIVIHSLDLTRGDPETKLDDDYVYNTYVKKYPNRFIGFSGIQAIDLAGRFSSESLKQFERAVTKLGFKGLKANPNYSGYAPDNKAIYPFYQKAVDLGVPVMLHMGTTGFTPAKFEYGHPSHLDDVALDFPGLKICAAHMAYPWQQQLFGLMRKCSNIYTDLSALHLRPLELAWHLVLAKEYNLMNRVMWGTDYPCNNPKKFVDWMQKGLNDTVKKCGWPPFSDQEIKQILGENAAEFLGLKT